MKKRSELECQRLLQPNEMRPPLGCLARLLWLLQQGGTIVAGVFYIIFVRKMGYWAALFPTFFCTLLYKRQVQDACASGRAWIALLAKPFPWSKLKNRSVRAFTKPKFTSLLRSFSKLGQVVVLFVTILGVKVFFDIWSIGGQLVIIAVYLATVLSLNWLDSWWFSSPSIRMVYFWHFSSIGERDLSNLKSMFVSYGWLLAVNPSGNRSVSVAGNRARKGAESWVPDLDEGTDPDWRQTVLRWLRRTDVVVINVTDIADSKWVGWEIVQCACATDPPVVILIANLLWLIETPDPAGQIRRAITQHVSAEMAARIMEKLPRPVPYFNDLSVEVTSGYFFRALRGASK